GFTKPAGVAAEPSDAIFKLQNWPIHHPSTPHTPRKRPRSPSPGTHGNGPSDPSPPDYSPSPCFHMSLRATLILESVPAPSICPVFTYNT
ncbi:hypothetical protein ACLOJK_034277, partial [Asimina triloba]